VDLNAELDIAGLHGKLVKERGSWPWPVWYRSGKAAPDCSFTDLSSTRITTRGSGMSWNLSLLLMTTYLRDIARLALEELLLIDRVYSTLKNMSTLHLDLASSPLAIP
jgi:hypothetical protein